MNWLPKLWARWFCRQCDKVEWSKNRYCLLKRHWGFGIPVYDHCPGYLYKGCPKRKDYK